MPTSPHIFDVNAANFEAEVIARSRHSPVLVDFWAAWCAPCQALMPLLEKLVTEYAGQFLLAKLDTDAEQALAAQWGVRGLPTVKLFKDGEVVDEFTGAQPESVIRDLLQAHLPRESDTLRAAAQAALQDGDNARARSLLQEALALDPDRLALKLEFAELLLDTGEAEAAQALLNELPINPRAETAVEMLLTRLHFARAVQDAPAAALLRERIAAAPDDLDARYSLGARAVMSGEYDAALEQFLEIMRRDRAFKDGLGRRGLVAVFELLGADDARVREYRRKMAALIY